MIQSINELYNKHTVLIKELDAYPFNLATYAQSIRLANKEGIKLQNMILFVPERLCFALGTSLGLQFVAIEPPPTYDTVCKGLLGSFLDVKVHTDIFSEDKLKQKEKVQLRGH